MHSVRNLYCQSCAEYHICNYGLYFINIIQQNGVFKMESHVRVIIRPNRRLLAYCNFVVYHVFHISSDPVGCKPFLPRRCLFLENHMLCNGCYCAVAKMHMFIDQFDVNPSRNLCSTCNSFLYFILCQLMISNHIAWFKISKEYYMVKIVKKSSCLEV